MDYKLIELKTYGDTNGKLISFEKNINVPFDIKRAFYIFDTKNNIIRGCHANRNSEFLLIAISGSCKIKIDNGEKINYVTLNNPHTALYLNKMIWKEMYEFSHNAILLVLTNTYYDENEYIRDYNDYKKEMLIAKKIVISINERGGGKRLKPSRRAA